MQAGRQPLNMLRFKIFTKPLGLLHKTGKINLACLQQIGLLRAKSLGFQLQNRKNNFDP